MKRWQIILGINLIVMGVFSLVEASKKASVKPKHPKNAYKPY